MRKEDNSPQGKIVTELLQVKGMEWVLRKGGGVIVIVIVSHSQS
jgi:hypothetical protein